MYKRLFYFIIIIIMSMSIYSRCSGERTHAKHKQKARSLHSVLYVLYKIFLIHMRMTWILPTFDPSVWLSILGWARGGAAKANVHHHAIISCIIFVNTTSPMY